ncbi:MAG: sulfatase-like hydrolase/transferase, partial [Planctomycetaceae bacterium]
MRRVTFLLALGFVACASPLSAAPPNIVLIMADDMGYECVAANGGTSYQTPNLDRLAAQGMRFEHCYSQPLCTPSRVQIMTGLYNQRNYIRFGVLDPNATTFAHVLKNAGYATCVVGKWQLEGGFDGPQRFGFDEYCLWQLTRRPGRYPNPGLEINGQEVDYTGGEYGPDLVSDYLCDFIERHKDGPFFAYYPMILPHGPFEPTPDSPDWDPTSKGKKGGGGSRRHFADMVAYTDKMVGKIVRKLEELKLSENTLVVFTCDNGTGRGLKSRMGDRVIPGGKGKLTDAGTHVPLIAWWPGTIKGGEVSQQLVDFTDVLPTLAEVAATEPGRVGPERGDSPADGRPRLDGHSLLPVLTGRGESGREWVYCWYAREGGRTGAQFARDRRFKLYGDGRLYDIAADPFEEQALPTAGLPDDAATARTKLQQVLDGFEGTRRLLPDPG